ncbi:MAG: zinc-ribbon domain-containing protein [Thermoplasmata archaeon]|nr:zinc-ribbon domain-containing protein [Thermoplasmata archaeon]
MVYCPNCGRENVDEAKFCIYCGAEIKRVGEKQKQAPQKTEKIEKTKTISLKSTIALMIAAIIISVSITIFVVDSFEKNEEIIVSNPNTIVMTVPEFFDALNYVIDSKNYTIYNSIMGVKNGDVLKIVGKIDKMENNYDATIGEYTSLALYYSNETSFLIHVFGNVSNQYNVGDYVITTFHIIECKKEYEDLYGTKWKLYGDFMKEQFLNEKFLFDIIIPQNQIREI